MQLAVPQNPRNVALASALVLLICFSFFVPAMAQSNLVSRPARPLLAEPSLQKLEPSTVKLAQELEVWDMLVELHGKDGVVPLPRRHILVRKITETILESYFDAMSVQAEADREIGNIEALRDRLSSKRDRAVEMNNGTNFIASGTLNTIGSILGFSAQTPPFSGNLNQMLSGVVSMGMSTYALKQQGGSRIGGEEKPTVLAELFGRPADLHTSYPESVWRFLHSKSPDEPEKTRVQVLEDKWIQRDHLERHGSKRESIKIDLVCGLPSKRKIMSIDDLNDQIEMIQDISSAASRMVHHLRDLLNLLDSDVLGEITGVSLPPGD